MDTVSPANASTAYGQEIASRVHPTTANELTSGITITNYEYREGNVKRYGAVGDGTLGVGGTDDTAALQTAFTFGAAYNVSIHIPKGTYWVTDPLFLTLQDGNYSTCKVSGAGRGWGNVYENTTIDGTSIVDGPVFMITAGRDCEVTDLTVNGPNVAPGSLSETERDYDSTWVTAGVRDEQHSPQCGICVDGNTTSAAGASPADTYPGIAYATEDGNASKGLTFTRINFYNHVVGLMLCPSLSLNGDVIKIDNCDFLNTKCSIANGQAQTKGTIIIGGDFAKTRTAYEALEYGQQKGRAPLFYGSQFHRVWELFNVDGSTGPASFFGIYAEALNRIGFGGNTQQLSSGVNFYGCEIFFFAPQVMAPILYECKFGRLNWHGGSIGQGSGAVYSEAFNFVAKDACFEGVSIEALDRFRPPIHSPAALVYHTQLKNCRVYNTGGGGYLTYGDETARVSLSGRVSASRTLPTVQVTPYDSTSVKYDYVKETDAGEVIVIGVSSAFTFVAGDTEFTFSNTKATEYVAGDVLYWKMDAQGASGSSWTVPALVVTGISDPIITCDLLFRRSDYDEAYSPTNAMYTSMRSWAPGEALTADTNGTTTLSNVDPVDILENGDWLAGAAGIAANTRVSSGGGTATIILTKAATDTDTGKALWWDRLHTVTTSAAF
jgi:hypothetical protein